MDTPWKFVIVEKLKPCTCAKGRLLYPLRSRGALAYCCCPPSANRPSGVMASAQRVSSSLQEAIADPQFFSHGDAKGTRRSGYHLSLHSGFRQLRPALRISRADAPGDTTLRALSAANSQESSHASGEAPDCPSRYKSSGMSMVDFIGPYQ